MTPIAIAFVMNALWLILSPWNLTSTLNLTISIAIVCLLLASYSFVKKLPHYTAITILPFLGIILSTYCYLPALKDYQQIALNLPATINASFQIERNHYPQSTTIKILSADAVSKKGSPEMIASTPNPYSAFIGSTLQVFNVPSEIKQNIIEGEIYQGVISIRARFHKNIPGDRQRILQSLARKAIGYGKFEGEIHKIKDRSQVDKFRQTTAQNFTENFQYGNYLSALSVGISQYLTTQDWETLRKTGTIHLVSISGLHLSLTAFYAFIIFRVTAALIGIRRIPPYKIAAALAIIVAWQYAIIAGLSLPTTRAAIMFTIAMLALLINRPIFSLHGVSIALVIILVLNPLSILLPGFWLSFVAVMILILSARIFTSPIKALLLTQLVISLLLIPLTASFFGEISLISPLTNLFAIPWTSMVIMPCLLLGTLFLFIHLPTAHFFNNLADQGVFVLTQSIQWSAKIPNASIDTSRLSLANAVIITFISLLILYFYPQRLLIKAWIVHIIRTIQRQLITAPTPISLQSTNKIPLLKKVSTIILTIIIFASTKQLPSLEKDSQKTTSIDLYLLPVGEGLSLLFYSQELTFLFDTGNRFRQFDAGVQVILPTLKSLGIERLDHIFLSLQNQQHTGGTRVIRTKHPNTPIIAHPKLLWLMEDAQDCRQYHYHSETITISPIKIIDNSCAFHITLFNEISLYLFSDITDSEWQRFEEQLPFMNKEGISQQIILFPNQGQRYFAPTLLQQSYLDHTLLFSTRKVAAKLEAALMMTPQLKKYNAYYGTIHLKIDTKNAKSYSKLRIDDYADKAHYWWLKSLTTLE